MDTLRLVFSFPISLAAYGLSMAILSGGPYLFLGQDKDAAFALFAKTTWLIDGVAAFLCVVAGGLVAPRRNAIAVSYVLASIPILIALKDIIHQTPFVSQEIVGTLLGVVVASIFLKRKTQTQLADLSGPEEVIAGNPTPSFGDVLPDRETEEKSNGQSPRRIFSFAVLAISIAFFAYELRNAERMSAMFPVFSRQAVQQRSGINSGPPPMAPEEAERFKTAADNGDAYSQFRTGVIYQYGLGGFLRNAVEAVRYYKLAVNQGNGKAETNLGMLYLIGEEGIQKDEEEAARLFKLGAEANDTVAQYWLGQMYRNGQGGLPKDQSEADRLIKLSGYAVHK